MRKIKKGDNVVVIAGRDKGKRGDVRARRRRPSTCSSNGINQVKKHQQPEPDEGPAGRHRRQGNADHVSNVAIWNPVTQKADRVGMRVLEDGRKVRFFKSNGEQWSSA